MTYRYRMATVFLLGFFIDCINIFMPVVALPRITAELGASNASSAWVGNAYILGLTLVIPLSPWLAGRWGARRMLTASMLAFSLAVWACGQAASFEQLLGWRLVQGMAGGLLIPVGQAMAFNLFQGEERARVSTLVMAVALIAPALSPMLGGMIVDHSSWRWVFHANIPLSLLAAALCWCWVRDAPAQALSPTSVTTRLSAPLRPDIWGLLLISAALACALLGMSLYGAGQEGVTVLLCLAAGAVFGGLYLRHGRQTDNAIVDLRLLKSPRLRVSILVYYAVPGIFTGVNLLNIFYLQDSLQLRAETTGMFMLVYACGALVAMVLGGRVYGRMGAPRLFLTGMLLHSLGIACLVMVDSTADMGMLVAAYGLMGLGGGMGANTAQTTALLDFDGQDTHQASVLWNINRQMAFSVGAAALLMVFNLLLHRMDMVRAYRLTFALAALAGLAPILQLRTLRPQKAFYA
ncbi:MFS transporter [Comamonas sp. GB3 AK4-5]|uniref:MFS transporter n=1 Tax=Comamonas sp. GB3 AK4-5 TaxID=3231487 RepID=UPI00351F6757